MHYNKRVAFLPHFLRYESLVYLYQYNRYYEERTHLPEKMFKLLPERFIANMSGFYFQGHVDASDISEFAERIIYFKLFRFERYNLKLSLYILFVVRRFHVKTC